jgi:chromosome segregation ATPase
LLKNTAFFTENTLLLTERNFEQGSNESLNNTLQASLQTQLSQAQQLEASLRTQLVALHAQIKHQAAEISESKVELTRVKGQVEAEVSKRKRVEEKLVLAKDEADEATAEVSVGFFAISIMVLSCMFAISCIFFYCCHLY